MKSASATKIAARFNDYLEASREQPVLITRNGKAVAVLLAVQDEAHAEKLVVDRSRSLRSIFEEAHEQIRKSGGFLTISFGGKSSDHAAPSDPFHRGGKGDRSASN